MWMSKAAAEMFATIVAKDAVNAELRTQLARERERVDWLSHHLNEIRLERAELYRRIGVYVPVPEISRPGVADLPGATDAYVPSTGGRVADIGDLMASARELRDRAEKTRLSDIAKAAEVEQPIGADMFDDVGDAAAQAIGATHDPTGSLIYAKPAR